MTRMARKMWKQAEAEAFDQGRWFSTFCHAPKGSHWFVR